MKCYMDETVDPCEEFYDYACGRWTDYHPIPKHRGGYDTFEILREDLSANLIKLFEEPPSEEDSESTRAVKQLYGSCMNTGFHRFLDSLASVFSSIHRSRFCRHHRG